MLKSLFIKNFILISELKIEFSSGLNIITGESGSGKSAILKAIDLLLGTKANPSFIFQNEERAIIEAIFITSNNDIIKKILSDYTLEKEVILRREISKNGKSRCFINDQLIRLSQLREYAIYFADYISQKQTSSLYQEKYTSDFVDTIADCKKEVDALFKIWNRSESLKEDIDYCLNEKSFLDKKINTLESEIELIEKVNYKENEDKLLEKEHLKLVNSHERKKFYSEICEILVDQPESVISKLRTIDRIFIKLQSMDCQVENIYKQFKNSFIELEELSFELSKINSLIEMNHNSLKAVEDRIKEIDNLKKAFGFDLNIINSKKREYEETIEKLQRNEKKIQSLTLKQNMLAAQIDDLCSLITFKRKNAQNILSISMQKELKSLNLDNTYFRLQLEKKKRSSTGNEKSYFVFSANPNIEAQPLQKIASGGELARVLLALKCIIANKDLHNCLIFDEIDSSVGGKSATTIGDKFLKLSQNKQLICVTHFVQVAKKANSHYLIKKTHKDGKSNISVTKLNDCQKHAEYQRMIGLTSLNIT